MGKDVHATLRNIAEKEGQMSAESADRYVAALKEQHRYHRDLY
jgi:sulfite reductase (NADPH) flavoprotein alpha-component